MRRSLLTSRKLRLETLETRQMLAGGAGRLPPPTPLPHMVALTQPVAVADVLPGQTFVIGKEKFFSATRTKGMLAEINSLPPDGSDRLASNINRVEVWANLKGGTKKDGPRKDGYEEMIGTGYPNWETDCVSITVNRPLWVSQTGVSVEYVATAGNWLDGDTIGMGTEYAVFCDLKGNYVDDGFTTYKGVDPTLHTLNSSCLYLSQQYMDQVGSAVAGQHNVDLLNYYQSWNENVLPGNVTFVASQGDMANIQSFSLWVDTNWDGVSEDCLRAGVTPTNGKLVFNLAGTNAPNGALYKVQGEVADILAEDPRIRMAFDAGGTGITAIDAETGLPLKGFMLNGVGAGQVQLWAEKDMAALYRFVAEAPKIDISLSVSSPIDSTVSLGESFTLLAIRIATSNTDALLSGVGFKLTPLGDGTPLPMPNFEKISVFADGVDLTSMISVTIYKDQIQVDFSSGLVIPGNTFKTLTLKGVVSNECSFRTSVSGAWSSDITTKWGNCNAVGNKVTVE